MKKLILTVLLLLLTGCVAASAQEPKEPEPVNITRNVIPVQATTTTTVDLSFLNTTTTTTQPKPTPKPATSEPTPGQWDALAYCESRNRADYPPVAGGFSGLLMFHEATWLGYGGDDYAAEAWQATRDQQIDVALRLWRVRGWQPWPGCSAKLGFN